MGESSGRHGFVAYALIGARFSLFAHVLVRSLESPGLGSQHQTVPVGAKRLPTDDPLVIVGRCLTWGVGFGV